jgi:hypothetical protein
MLKMVRIAGYQERVRAWAKSVLGALRIRGILDITGQYRIRTRGLPRDDAESTE